MPDNNGNIPKRSDERMGHGGSPTSEITHAEAFGLDSWPPEERDWHHIAKRWYRSLSKSGQSRFYEESDAATAVFVAEMMSRALKQGGKPSSMLVSAVMAGANDLLTTEAARRRLRVELDKPKTDNDEEMSAAHVDGYIAELAELK